MASGSESLNNSKIASEEMRLKTYLTHVQNRAELETRETEAKHGEQLQRLTENFQDRSKALKEAYDVQISREAESLEEKLHTTRMKNEERVETEKRAGEEEVAKVRTQQQQKVEEYRKNSEAQLDSLRKQLQASADALHEKARKSANREQKKEG
jgi:hypothetical protein